MDETGGTSTEAAKQLCERFQSGLELRPSTCQGITLARPDGYSAYSADDGGASALESVGSLLERQVSKSERSNTIV
jgi:hypothetical protein